MPPPVEESMPLRPQRVSPGEVQWLMNHTAALFNAWTPGVTPGMTVDPSGFGWSVTVNLMDNGETFAVESVVASDAKVTFTVSGMIGDPSSPNWQRQGQSNVYTAWLGLMPGLAPASASARREDDGSSHSWVIELSGG